MSKILIVDDDPDLTEITGIHLSNAGYEVAVSNSRKEAMKAVHEEKPDLIVLDIMMETEDDGIVMAQDLRREGINTPIIMLTSMGTISGMNFGRDNDIVPVDEFMNKPVDAEKLIENVKKLLK